MLLEIFESHGKYLSCRVFCTSGGLNLCSATQILQYYTLYVKSNQKKNESVKNGQDQDIVICYNLSYQ